MDFGLYEMKIVRNNPSSVKSDPRVTRTNDLSPLGSDLSEVYCICIHNCIHTCVIHILKMKLSESGIRSREEVRRGGGALSLL